MKNISRIILLLFIVLLISALTLVGAIRGKERQEPATTAASTQNANSKSIDNIDPNILATMRQQEALQPAVTALYEAYMKEQDSGFAGIAFEGDGVTLYWKGPFSPEMSAAINLARETAPIQIMQAAVSMAEMKSDAEKIHKRVQALGGSEIQKVVTKYDGSGLVL